MNETIPGASVTHEIHRVLAGGSYLDKATATAIRLIRRSAELVVGA